MLYVEFSDIVCNGTLGYAAPRVTTSILQYNGICYLCVPHIKLIMEDVVLEVLRYT
jgi:hypothetical protein